MELVWKGKGQNKKQCNSVHGVRFGLFSTVTPDLDYVCETDPHRQNPKEAVIMCLVSDSEEELINTVHVKLRLTIFL